MIEFQRYTGCRPGEACIVRACDVDMTGDVWLYRPAHHKLAYRDSDRVIALGPKAQNVVKEFLTTRTEDYLFSPRAARLVLRKKRKPKRAPGERYTTVTYGGAIGKACRKAGIARWSPNRLRHSFATDVRKRFGIEPVQALLGHARLNTSEIYAEKNLLLATEGAAKIG
jgi:integrase